MKLPRNVELFAIEMYQKGEPSAAISKKLGIGKSSIPNILRRHNLEPRKLGEHKRRHFFDERRFAIIDNQNKAYWLGFLCADGSISESNYCIKLCLAAKDRSHVEAFARFIGTDIEVKYRKANIKQKQYGSYYASVASKKMYEDLVKLGCGPRKSLTLNFPKIPREYFWHFVRGYFDGDGCICKRNYHISIACSEIFAQQLGMRLREIGFTNSISPHGKIYYVDIHGIDQIKEFRQLLYSEASTFLQRKRDIFDTKNKRSMKERFIKELSQIETIKNSSYKEIREKTGLTLNRIHHLKKCKTKLNFRRPELQHIRSAVGSIGANTQG